MEGSFCSISYFTGKYYYCSYFFFLWGGCEFVGLGYLLFEGYLMSNSNSLKSTLLYLKYYCSGYPYHTPRNKYIFIKNKLKSENKEDHI